MNKAKELAEAHWEYVEGLLKSHMATDNTIIGAKFHYISAFIHGYKHGQAELQKSQNFTPISLLELL